jgi:TolB-like protein
MGLIAELRRRNVLRMAVLYLGTAWLVMQVTDVLEGPLSLPEWTGGAVLAVLAVGFPIALVLSWFYEVTPEGVTLDDDVRSVAAAKPAGRRADFIVIAVLAAAVLMFAYDKWWIPEPTAQSIAVLPFDNMSGDPEQEYFSDGLSDTLIHVLAQVSGLRVTAKTSSFYFKGKNMNVGDIGQELRVGTILEGSVQRVGDQIRVIAQLVRTEDGTHLWSKSFDRNVEDVFAVQDEIAQEVVNELSVTLLDEEEKRLAQRYQPKLDAYEQLILGRHELAKHTSNSAVAAEQHFKRAIELDPDYALAYVGLADAYSNQESYGSLTFEELLRRIQPLIEKAIELDPKCAEAYEAKAGFRFALEMKAPQEELDGAEEEVLRAIELNPNSVQALIGYSGLLRSQGRLDEALAQVRLAADRDPMAPGIQTLLARRTWEVGRAEEAVKLTLRNIEWNPEYPDNYDLISQFYTQLGRLGEAQLWIQEARKRNPDAYKWWGECLGFINLGDQIGARICVQQLTEAYPDKVISLVTQAAFYHGTGDFESAIALLESLRERVPGLPAYDRWLANLVAWRGDIERARQLMADSFPEFLEDKPDLTSVVTARGGEMNLYAAVVFAAILDANGEMRERDALLAAIEEQIAKMHRIRGVGYGILDVYIYAMRGERDRAVAGLREAIDVGWRGGNFGWSTLRYDWKLAILHGDPEFIALMDELEADIGKQREWYEEHKDD